MVKDIVGMPRYMQEVPDAIDLGDLIRVKATGETHRVTATADNGDIISGVQQWSEDEVELVSRMQCSR